MKRFLALILAAIMLAAALASCTSVAPGTPGVNANIRVTSSDALDVAAWLTDRLGDKLTDRLVIGTDADAYGVDVSTLADDGYVIRAVGDETAIFAATDAGLDRAAREYAKAVEAGRSVADATYHESAPIKNLIIAGRDITEYTIYAENEEKIIESANDLAAHLKTATGAQLSVSTDEAKAPYIALCYIHDDALGSVGSRWSVTEGGLTIECSDAYKKSSSLYAVRRFLETKLDWYGLVSGFEDLRDADLIEIAAGESGEEKCAFEWSVTHGGWACLYDRFDNDIQDINFDRHTCHGMQNHKFGGELSESEDKNWAYDQPCFLDETFYEAAKRDVEQYIIDNIKSGKTPGDDFVFVDLGAGDNGYWCECKDCSALLRKEGSVAAHVLTFANRLSEELNEKYKGINYGIFAYAGTNRPPKTMRPNDLVYVTYCFDFNCSEHPLDGSRCMRDPSKGVDFGPHDNKTFAGHFLGWTEICDNLYVWYYGLPNSLLTMSYMHLVREDWTWLYRSGAKGVYWEAEDTGYETNWIAKQLANQLLWDIEMSDERFSELYDRALYATYGDGYALIRGFVTTIDRIYEATPCMNCWAFGVYSYPDYLYTLYVDPDMIAEKYDLMFDLLEAAIPLARNRRQEQRCVALQAGLIYKGSVAAYPKAQAAHDTERMAELSRRYALMRDRLLKFGVDITNRSQLIGWSGNAHPATIEELYPEGEHRERYVNPKITLD